MRSSKAAAAVAPPAASGSGHKVPGQKKSCDLCVFRKRRCDGAIPTCGFCLSRGSECHYSLRRPNRPRGYRELSNGGNEGQPGVEVEGNSGTGYGTDDEESREIKGRHHDLPPTGWKRVRLSASPATGLVGTKENVYLGCFFSCLGFLPLTDERLIRGTMMDILLASPNGSEIVDQASAEGADPVNTERPTTARQEDQAQGGSDTASACALWCTIAMGALVQGQPPEQVAPYMHFAWASLSRCFDTITVESGRAFLMMAYLYNFMRDEHNFCKYLQFARRVVNRLPENSVQKQEIDDLVMMGNDTRIFHTAALEPSELDDYCADNSPALHVPDVVHKSDLCHLLLHADRRMMKAFLRDHRAQAASHLEQGKGCSCYGGQAEHMIGKGHSGDNQECQRLEEIEADGTCASGGEEGYLSGMSIKMEGRSIDSTKIDQETSPSRPGDETWKYTDEARRIFARLGEAADAPEMRAGVGSLLYNSILGYLDMVTGNAELEAGFAKVKHCTEIISRYPGLCRFSTWRHLSHCLLSFLSKLGDVELFEGLRQAYNSVCAHDAPQVPHHAEWTMVGFCDHIFCRSMDHLDKTWGGLSPAQPLTARDLEGQRWLSEELHRLHDTSENNVHWASRARELQPAEISGQRFSIEEWTHAMAPHFVDATSVSAQQRQYMASAPSFSAVEPHSSMAPINPVWFSAGHAPVLPPDGRAFDGASAYVGAREDDHSHNGWHSSAPPAASNASLGYRGAGAMWPYSSGRAAASSERITAPTARTAFGEQVAHNGAVGEGGGFRGTSGSSTSEGAHGTAKRSDDRFQWWSDAGPPN